MCMQNAALIVAFRKSYPLRPIKDKLKAVALLMSITNNVSHAQEFAKRIVMDKNEWREDNCAILLIRIDISAFR